MTKKTGKDPRTEFERKYFTYKTVRKAGSPVIVENAFYSIQSTVLHTDKIPDDVKAYLQDYFSILEHHLKEILVIYND